MFNNQVHIIHNIIYKYLNINIYNRRPVRMCAVELRSFWRFRPGPHQPGLPVAFCEPYEGCDFETKTNLMKVVILKQKQTDPHFSKAL